MSSCLWFDSQAEEAANFYVDVFSAWDGKAKIENVDHYDEASAAVSGKPAGSVMTVGFQLDGEDFMALNGGPEFKFTPAISFVINCETQEEVDHFWNRLTEKGKPVQCGWLEDRFGVSWQVVPNILDKYLRDPDPVKAKRVMEAMLKMIKIDIAGLEQAYNQQ